MTPYRSHSQNKPNSQSKTGHASLVNEDDSFAYAIYPDSSDSKADTETHSNWEGEDNLAGIPNELVNVETCLYPNTNSINSNCSSVLLWVDVKEGLLDSAEEIDARMQEICELMKEEDENRMPDLECVSDTDLNCSEIDEDKEGEECSNIPDLDMKNLYVSPIDLVFRDYQSANHVSKTIKSRVNGTCILDSGCLRQMTPNETFFDYPPEPCTPKTFCAANRNTLTAS